MSESIFSTQPNIRPTAPPPLPNEPLTTIQPGKSWGALDLREVWAAREMLYFLMWRDVKVRYKQTALGVVWVVMQPLLMTLIFTVFLGGLARVPTGGIPYPLLVYTGLLPWTFFSSAVAGCGQSLVANAHLITKVYFPRVLIPASAVGGRLIDFAVSFVVLAGLMLYYRVAPTPQLLALPLLVVLMLLLSLGLGMLVAALNVKYRDVGVVVPVLLQLWMFVSPVLYPSGLIPAKWHALLALNPMVGVVEGFRVALLGGHFDTFALAVSTAIAAALFLFAAYFFQRVERNFADVI
jgi:lipopolysaccharide transport system permease protein